MIKECRKNLVPITKSELNSLSKYMLDSSAMLPEDDAITLKAFIKIVFGFSSITVSEYYGAHLYLTLLRILVKNIEE